VKKHAASTEAKCMPSSFPTRIQSRGKDYYERERERERDIKTKHAAVMRL
jgi:hypothetical protein